MILHLIGLLATNHLALIFFLLVLGLVVGFRGIAAILLTILGLLVIGGVS